MKVHAPKLKASSGEQCAPRNLVLFVTFRRYYTCSSHHDCVPRSVPDEIDYENKMLKQIQVQLYPPERPH